MPRLALLTAATVLASSAAAQFVVVIPAGTGATEGASSAAYPWGRGNQQTRVQYIYDSSHFTTQGITTPILINQLRFRANGATTVAGYTYSNATVRLSSAAVDYLAPSTTFAGNHGVDLATAYSGAVTVLTPAGTTPNTWYVTIPVTPFLYDPTTGVDLCVDAEHYGAGPTGTAGPAHDCATTNSLTSRVYNLTNAAWPYGSTQLNVGATIEIGYVLPVGVYPKFTAAPLSVPLNTNVAFSNTTYTSDPAGVTLWQWDFENDGIIDSNLQDPVHAYPAEGIYSVRLVATDALNGTASLIRTNYIAVDTVDAAFAANVVGGTTVQFTDRSPGNPTTWAWDFESDGLVDSNLQNPQFTYPIAGGFHCKLTVTDAISTDTVTVNLGVGTIPMPAFGSTFEANTTRGFWFRSPTRFSITSLQVPDETGAGSQVAAVYRLAGVPPFSTTVTTASGGLEFVSGLVSSNAPIPCVVSFDAGEYVGVLGACGSLSSLAHSNGTPGGPFASSVLGQPVTLTRFITQTNIAAVNGTGAYSSSDGAVSRVNAGVSAAVGLQYGTGSPSPYAPAPTLKTTALPILGQNAVLGFTTNDAAAIGIVAAGFGPANLPTPLGTLLLASIDFTDVINGAAVLTPGTYTYSFAVPNNPVLQGFGPLNWQAAGLVVPTGELALSNATEWWLAQ